MVFLIEYDRPSGKLVHFQEFDDSKREAARQARLELELASERIGNRHEVVILEAPSVDALRHTHGRYFKNLAELESEWAAKLS